MVVEIAYHVLGVGLGLALACGVVIFTVLT